MGQDLYKLDVCVVISLTSKQFEHHVLEGNFAVPVKHLQQQLCFSAPVYLSGHRQPKLSVGGKISNDIFKIL